MKSNIEGYVRPILMQLQWCLSLLSIFNTIILVLGKPPWFRYVYYTFPVLAIAWILYYFKRGRVAEMGNISGANPVLTKMREALGRIEEKLSND